MSLPEIEVVMEGDTPDLLAWALQARRTLEENVPSELANLWGPKLVQWQQDNILRGTDIFGEPFEELSPATIAARTQDALSPHRAGGRQQRPTRSTHPYGVRPLLDTSAMFQSIRWETPGPGEVTAGATELSPEGFNYPEAHVRGTSRMPARVWSGLRQDNIQELERDTAEAVLRALGG